MTTRRLLALVAVFWDGRKRLLFARARRRASISASSRSTSQPAGGKQEASCSMWKTPASTPTR